MVSGAFGAAITPGAVFSLFGTRLGPAQIQTAELTAEGNLPTEIAGTRVLFDGVPAPLLFVLDGQLSGVVPFATTVTVVNGPQGTSTVDWSNRPEIIVERDGVASEPELYHVHNASPAIFTVGSATSAPAAALNQDGSLNTAANPAARGSIVTFWATGFGALSPTPIDGSVNTEPFAQPQLAVEVAFGFHPGAEILYAGSAPGLVAGVMQVNARVPMDVTETEPRVVLRVGEVENQGQFVTVFVAP